MIRPQPESDLSMNILVLGSEVAQILKDKRSFVVIEELLEKFLIKDKRRTPDLFMDTLTYLYSLNMIEYEGYKVKINDFTQMHLF